MLNKFIDDHSRNLQEGNSERLSCPSCGGINTFTITKMQGFVLWNCYKASCSVRGGKDSERTKSDIAHKLRSNYHVTCTETFLEPDSFTNFREHPKPNYYLKKNNCMEAIDNGDATVKYDYKMNRTVFLIKNSDGVVVDAVGRALDYRTTPKWYRYGKSDALFTCGSHSVAAIVEDVASACAISPIATGIALLGTNLKTSSLASLWKLLKGFDHVYLCLDPDATRKSLDLHKYLSYIVPCSVVRIKDDLKYYNKEEIRKLVLNNKY